MGDLISRQDAIDALSVGKEALNRVLDEMDIVGTDREKYSWGLGLIESAIKDIEELPSAESEPPWIPISDGLPKKSGVYTVTNHKDEVVRYTFNNSKTSKDYWKRCVKAWMPLPEPYKGG